MKFWDASAVVPILIREASSDDLLRLFEADPDQVVWWGTGLECISAIARRASLGDVEESEAATALERLDDIQRAWKEVAPSEDVRSMAVGLLHAHRLRAADALQLAAARVTADGTRQKLDFVCLDRRLSDAAAKEGFAIVPAEIATKP